MTVKTMKYWLNAAILWLTGDGDVIISMYIWRTTFLAKEVGFCDSNLWRDKNNLRWRPSQFSKLKSATSMWVTLMCIHIIQSCPRQSIPPAPPLTGSINTLSCRYLPVIGSAPWCPGWSLIYSLIYWSSCSFWAVRPEQRAAVVFGHLVIWPATTWISEHAGDEVRMWIQNVILTVLSWRLLLSKMT